MASKKNSNKKTTKTVAKKAPVKKTVTKKNSAKTSQVKASKNNSLSNLSTIYNVRRKQIITILAILVVIAILYSIKGLFIAALVNGQPISRFTVIGQLEKANGQKALQNLVTETLIQQEADKRGVSVSQADIDKQVATISKNIQSQGMTLDAALAQQGMTMDDLRQQVKLQLLLDKMIKPVTVSNKEISDYINANKSQFPSGTSDATMTAQAKQAIISQKKQQESQDLVQTLQKNAKVSYFVNY